jgi:ABC-2 type transport system ATP-binding protein
MASVIEVQQLSKRYTVYKRKGLAREKHVIQALDKVSFSIEEGTFLGYIGPNGAGKSTTVKILTGIIVPEEGRVTIKGLCPWKHRKNYVKKIGVVFGQKTQMWWDLPVIETYRALGALYDVAKPLLSERIAMLCDRLSLSEFLNQPVRQLSLGQRMRAEVGASLIHDPDILFLDEPSIGLDVVSHHQMMVFLKELHTQGKTIFLTTHNLREIELLCNRILLLHRGKRTFLGSVEELKQMIRLPTVIRARVQTLRNTTDPLPAVFASMKISLNPEKQEISIEIPAGESTGKLSKWLMDHYPVEDLSIEEPDIEEVVKLLYQQLTDEQEG